MSGRTPSRHSEERSGTLAPPEAGWESWAVVRIHTNSIESYLESVLTFDDYQKNKMLRRAVEEAWLSIDMAAVTNRNDEDG